MCIRIHARRCPHQHAILVTTFYQKMRDYIIDSMFGGFLNSKNEAGVFNLLCKAIRPKPNDFFHPIWALPIWRVFLGWRDTSARCNMRSPTWKNLPWTCMLWFWVTLCWWVAILIFARSWTISSKSRFILSCSGLLSSLKFFVWREGPAPTRLLLQFRKQGWRESACWDSLHSLVNPEEMV